MSSVSVSILLSASDDMPKSRVLTLLLLLGALWTVTPSWKLHKSKWRVKGEIVDGAKARGTSGHSWFYEIPLHASYVPLRPTVAPLLQHEVFTAATHYPRMNIAADWMPLHELIEHKVTARKRPLIKNCEMEPLNASDETIPLFPNQLVKLGHHIKDKQLQRPKSGKMVHGGCYASASKSGMASFSVFQFTRGSRKVCSDQVIHMTFTTCHVTCDTAKMY